MKLKRTLSLLMTLCLLFSLASTAFAAGVGDTFSEGGIKYKIRSENTVEVTEGSYSGAVIVPASVEHEETTYSVVGLGERAFQDVELSSLTLPETITYIGTNAFVRCKLTSLAIPAKVERIGENAFLGSSLQTITFVGDSVLESIGSAAFAGCSSLSTLVLPDTEMKIGAAVFAGCSSLVSITIPAKATLNPEVFNGIQSYDAYYDESKISFAEGSKNKIIDGILYDDENLLNVYELKETVTVPEGIIAIEAGAFYCSPSNDTLKSITFPSTLRTIGNSAFVNNKGLTQLEIPVGVTSIGEQAFSGCSGLTAVTLNAEIAEIQPYTFSGCSSLQSFSIPDAVTKIGDGAFNKCKNLTNITIPNSVTEIGASAFEECTSLASVELPRKLETLGTRAFTKCSSLTEVEVPDGVSKIESWTFGNCTALDTVVLPGTVSEIAINAFGGALGTRPLSGTNAVLVIKRSTAPTVDLKAFGVASGQPVVREHLTVLVPAGSETKYSGDEYTLKPYIRDNSPYGITMTNRSVKVASAAPANTLTYTAVVPTGTTLSVESSNTDVATAAVESDGKTITVTSVSQGDAVITAKIALSSDGPVILTKTATVTVLAADKEPVIVVPAESEAKTELPTTATTDEKNLATAVETALKPAEGSTGLTVETEKLSAAANTITAQNQVSEDAGKQALENAGLISTGSGSGGEDTAKVSIVVQPYMEVTIKDVKIESTTSAQTKTLTLDITPKYQKVATTAELDKATPDEIVVKKDSVNNANAVVMETGDLTITVPVEVQVPLPADFAADGALYVIHYKEDTGRSYVYTGSVEDSILTFINSHGFSTFTMSTADPTEATIGETSYPSLQDALDDAATGSTVKVLKDNLSGSITATKTITLKNTDTANAITVTVNGTEYTLAANGTQAVSYTRPSGGGSIGGATTDISGSGSNVSVNASGGTVSANQMTAAVEKASEGATIEIKATNAATVSLPVSGVEKAVANDNAVTVATRNGEVTLSADAIEGLVDGASSGQTIQVSVTPATASDVGLAAGTPVFDVSVAVGSTAVHSFDGSLTITLTVSNLSAIENPYVLHILTDGTKQYLKPTVSGNQITVSGVRDLSYFAVIPGSEVPQTLPFTDVAQSAYYYDAVQWAYSNSITGGTSATTFAPELVCTRAQVVTFLWRAAGEPKATAANPFTDVKADAYYYDAVLWAVEEGITVGTTATTFSPDATVTRGQFVTFLYRYAGSPATDMGSVFTDVAPDAYYAPAVAWAAAEQITSGTSATTFSPAEKCTRGQTVTFIYRYMTK